VLTAFGLLLLLLVACGAVLWTMTPHEEPASVAWPVASPESQGFDEDALESLVSDLADRNTKALLLVRRGHVVLEWYAPDFGPNRRHYTAAMAKGTSAAPALIAALGSGLLSLDDRVADWVPSWGARPDRANIKLRDLAFHASGLEDVDFDAGQAGKLPGWQQRYYDHPDERFRLGLDSAAVRFAPGTRFGYSGVGYYVLSYVVSRALQNGSQSARDIPSFLGEAIYGPLGIPPEAWTAGYARSDTVDGLALTHFGSGGRLTARAAARIGLLFLQGGCYEGRRLLDAELVDVALGRRGVTPIARDEDSEPEPASAAGWWRNVNGAWPSAPTSAAAALGQGHQVVWIDPDLEIVAVRMGEDLSAGSEPFHAALDRYLAAPLYAALEEAGPSRSNGPGVAEAPRIRDDPSAPCAD
jgi:CubicO group peptidase (beta-lactamase class C family)